MTFLLVALTLSQAPNPERGVERLDRLRLTNGAQFEGVVLRDLPSGGMQFRVVHRDPRRPTLTITMTLERNEIAAIERISDEQRRQVLDRLALLDPDGSGERSRMDGLTLSTASWPDQRPARKYESDQFVLISRAAEEITRRAAVRLEDLFTAMQRYGLAPAAGTKRVEIWLAGTPDEYRALVAGRPELVQLAQRHPALFDPSGPRVLCGSDLGRLATDLAATRLAHTQQLATIASYEASIRKLYKGSPTDLNRFLAIVSRERRRIASAERANDSTFARTTRQLFALLSHETYHALAASQGLPLPRWLDEGLAQLFEGAFVEAGEVHFGRPDPVRLARLQGWLQGKGGTPIPLRELLRAGPGDFLALHAADAAASDRAYLTSWGVATYLLLGQRLLSTEARQRYALALAEGTDPISAFEALTGEPLEKTEAKWRDYIRKLAPT